MARAWSDACLAAGGRWLLSRASVTLEKGMMYATPGRSSPCSSVSPDLRNPVGTSVCDQRWSAQTPRSARTAPRTRGRPKVFRRVLRIVR